MNYEPHPHEFFQGHLSPIDIFDLHCEQVLKVQADSLLAVEDDEEIHDSTPEIALVALIAYAEAFFRGTFAAVGNLTPRFLEHFSSRRKQLAIPLEDYLLISQMPLKTLGSLVAEQFDFGSAKLINGLFRDLLEVTPFSSSEGKKFDHLCGMRNLVVHHGGLVTVRHFKSLHPNSRLLDRLYADSAEITPDVVRNGVELLLKIAEKLTISAYKKMVDAEGDVEIVHKGERYLVFRYLLGYGDVLRRNSKKLFGGPPPARRREPEDEG